MDWGRLGAWLYENGTPDYGKLARFEIGTVYVDPRSTNAHAVITDLAAHGLQAGIYEVPQWYGSPSPGVFAQQVSDDIKRLIPQAYPLPSQTRGAPVMLDLEIVDSAWVSVFAVRYHALRPARETAYTNEPFKDGTVVPIADLRALGWHWYVQLYRGDMTPVDAAAAVLEPCRWGYPATLVHPFYDGARLPVDARDGCVFTMERLP